MSHEAPDRQDVEIGAAQDGMRLDQALVALLPGWSRSRIQRWIRDGLVTDAAGRPALQPGDPVRAGQVFAIRMPPAEPTAARPQALPLRVIFEDADIIVVDKPAGMVVHPGAGHREGTLVNALLHHAGTLSTVGGPWRPGIVHRLDRGTSGLLVVARHDHVHAALARQFHDREVEKRYLALVWGQVEAGQTIEAPIGRDPRHRHRMSTRARRARAARSQITRAEPLRGVTLAEIAIATGRTHQIRVHLSAIGHPVVGDAIYGGVHRRLPAHLRPLARLERPFLHAARLAFRHPTSGAWLDFVCPLPDDLASVLDELRAIA